MASIGTPKPSKRASAARQGRLSKVFVAVHAAIVLLPIAVVALWAFADSWAWPHLLPQSFSLRGVELVLSEGRDTGLSMMVQSVLIALAAAVLTTLVAALAARAVSCYEWAGRKAFGFGLVTPFLIPTTVFAMGVQVLFIKAGIARTVPGVVLAHAIVALPYSAVIMMDMTDAVGTRLEDAAKALGASPLKAVRHVTLPALLPGIVSSLSMAYIMSFSQYFLTLLIGGGAVRTLAVVMFPYLSGGDRTIAAAYGLVFIASTFAVFLFFEWLMRRFGMREDGELYG